MSVTDDPIPHGARGYRKPWECRCDICKAGIAEYNRDQRKARKDKQERDEVAAKRKQRAASKGPAISTAGTRAAAAKRTESSDSVSKRGGRRTVGEMEQAVIDECAQLELAAKRPTVVVAARNLARLVDDLSGTSKGGAVQVSTTKQIMSMIDSLRPKDTSATGKRKSGGRLATVGNLTKVKRQGA